MNPDRCVVDWPDPSNELKLKMGRVSVWACDQAAAKYGLVLKPNPEKDATVARILAQRDTPE